MYFFRGVALLVALLIQSAVVLADVTEIDVLDSPVVLHDKKPTSELPVHQVVRVSVPDGHVLFVGKSLKKRTSPSYLLDAGDMIEIKVFGQKDLSLSTRLDESGVINYPFLGEVPAVGMTTSDLEQLITRGLKDGYLVSPHVHISMVEYRPFYIKGQVTHPGSYPYQPGLTLAKAITIAGGFSKFAARNDVLVVREKDKQHESKRITFSDLVHPDDTVTVNESFFYIDGEVNNPGKYPLRAALTVREAISLAGGLTERAATDKIYVKVGKGSLVNIGQDSDVRSGSSIVVQQSFF